MANLRDYLVEKYENLEAPCRRININGPRDVSRLLGGAEHWLRKGVWDLCSLFAEVEDRVTTSHNSHGNFAEGFICESQVCQCQMIMGSGLWDQIEGHVGTKLLSWFAKNGYKQHRSFCC